MGMLAMLLAVAMVAVIIGADFLFVRHNFWGRLLANITIVVVFGAIYVIFLKRP
jgi:hypothetical protein